MTWRQALADWKELDQRRPAAWWLGLSGTIAGAIALAALELHRIAPRGPARWILVAALVLAIVAVGRRVFWNDAERRLRLPWRIAGYVLLVGLLNLAALTLGLHMSGSELQRGSGPALRVTAAALVMFTLASIVAVRLFDRRPVRELGIVPGPGFWGDLAFGLALGAVLMTLDLRRRVAGGMDPDRRHRLHAGPGGAVRGGVPADGGRLRVRGLLRGAGQPRLPAAHDGAGLRGAARRGRRTPSPSPSWSRRCSSASATPTTRTPAS